jgi:LPXTG-motif cell wall-anchored protein
MSKLLVSGVALAALLAAATPAPASLETYDKLAILTFTAPVQVPGATLKAGTYRFALANAATGRNVLHVFSNDGKTVYTMFHTLPEWRVVATAEPTVTFRETPAGVPVAARALFYGGEHTGYAFMYPKGEPIMKAEVRPQPPITYTEIPKAVAPAEPEWKVSTEPLFLEPVPFVEPTEQPVAEAAPAPEQAPAQLPKTASPLPFMALGGMTSLLLGFGLLRRRSNN